jgi:DNA-binding Xre family transcriptional regulator
MPSKPRSPKPSDLPSAIDNEVIPFKPLSKLDALLYTKGISQSDLLRKMADMFETPVEQYMLSRIQCGKQKNYHTDTLIRICRALDVTPNDILDWEDREL